MKRTAKDRLFCAAATSPYGAQRGTFSRHSAAFLALGALFVGAAVPCAALSQPASGTSSAVPTPVQGTDQVGEVVVTAQRRTENVQKSSLDIQVVGAQQLSKAGVSQATDLNSLVPGLQISQAGASTDTYIRGVGDVSTNGLAENSVSFYIDGVVIDRPAGIATNFYDLARVEVLQGPQGTLYGRNASGGAINLITNRPGPTFGGYLTAEFGDYDLKRFTGAVNLPVNDQLSLRTAFLVVDRDGYLSNGDDDNKQQDGRIELRWAPTPRFTALLEADVEHQGGHGEGGVQLPRQPGNSPWTSLSSPADVAALEQQSFGIAAPPTETNYLHNNMWDVSGEFTYDLGFADLTFIPAFRSLHLGNETNTGDFPVFNNENSQQTSYELRLGKNLPGLKWVAGLYYFNVSSKASYGVTTEAIPVVPFENSDANVSLLDTTSYAAFGEATYSLTTKLRFIGGLRYTYEAKDIDGIFRDDSGILPLIPGVGLLSLANVADFHALTYKAGLEYDLSPRNMFYFTASSGFKSGGFYNAPGDNVYQPEHLYAYEVGFRNRFLDNRLQFNVAGFYWDYDDRQENVVGFTPAGTATLLVRNAQAATIGGVDADVIFRLTPNDTIHTNFEYLTTNFDNFNYPYPAALAPGLNTTCAVSGTVSGTPPTVNVNCSGKPLDRAPSWTGNFGIDHTFVLPNAARLVASGDVSYATSRYLTIDYTATELAPGYAQLDTYLTYTPAGARWSLTAYVKNVNNAVIYTDASQSVFANRLYGATIQPPRTYGARATLNF